LPNGTSVATRPHVFVSVWADQRQLTGRMLSTVAVQETSTFISQQARFLCWCSPDLPTSCSSLLFVQRHSYSVLPLHFNSSSDPTDIFWNNTRDPSTRSRDETQVLLPAPIPHCHPSSYRNWNSLSTCVVVSYASVTSKGLHVRLMRTLLSGWKIERRAEML